MQTTSEEQFTQSTTMYILNGQTPTPCPDAIQWGKWMEATNRTVRHTFVTNKVEVSTVFLGINMCSPPELFETMVFGFHPWHMRVIARYSTYRGAELGHQETVQQVMRTLWQRMSKGKKALAKIQTRKKDFIPISSMYIKGKEDIENGKEKTEI